MNKIHIPIRLNNTPEGPFSGDLYFTPKEFASMDEEAIEDAKMDMVMEWIHAKEAARDAARAITPDDPVVP